MKSGSICRLDIDGLPVPVPVPVTKPIRNLCGFTLIEMVVVMAIIGLLLTLAMPRYFTAIESSKTKVQLQNLSTMRDALDKFFGDQGRYPVTLDELIQKRYLRSMPVDPVTGHADWVVIAPTEPNLSGVYDIRSAGQNEQQTDATH